ncbi:MAG: sugar ABC transporter substrate-binding protein [Mesorhizobium sp.]|nr:MAG: sugar ABC transporter substrate-binding protein [Mesorhizobium sp.]TJW50039.1 MAG: sugar ABC transporter substrate-binding protein [Mesorhizobium sp.]
MQIIPSCTCVQIGRRKAMTKLMRRLSSAVFVAATLIFAGAAQAQEKTTITFLADEEAPYKPVIEAFEKLHPDIKVVFQLVPWNDLNAAVESRVGQGDTGIDVILTDMSRVPAFASKGDLLDVSERAGAIKAANPNPADLDQVSYDGKVYAYPMWTSTQLLFYNRKLLKSAGIEFPSGDPSKRLTWDQLLEKAAAAQKAGAKWGVQFQQPDNYYQLQMLFESAGAGPGLKGDGLMESDIASNGWVKTAQWYSDLFSKGISPRGVSPDQTTDQFINGEVAFMIGGTYPMGRYNAADDLDYGVAPVPYFKDGKPVTPTGSLCLSLNPHSQHIDAARAFAEFASLNAEGNYLTVSVYPLIPTNAGAFKTYAQKLAAETEKIGPAIDIINYELQNTAVARPRTIGYVTFETLMIKAFGDIRNGADVSDTLKAADQQLTRQLSRLR